MPAVKKKRRPRAARRKSGMNLAFWRSGSRRRKRRATVSSRIQRWRKRWRGWRRTLRYVRQQLAPYGLMLALAAGLVVMAGLWAGGILAQWRQEVDYVTQRVLVAQGFSVQTVSVIGRRHTTKDELNRALQVTRGESLFHVDLEEARRRIEALDWVDRASISRLWPDTLHIVLVERRPAAVWQIDGALKLVDRAGGVIAPVDGAAYAGLPHIVGAGAARETAALIALLDRHPDIRARLRAAIRVGERRWTLRLDNGVDVHLPDEGEDEALSLLGALDARHRLLARDIVAVDLRVRGRLFVRLPSDRTVQLAIPGVNT